jgi:hypothetical protein
MQASAAPPDPRTAGVRPAFVRILCEGECDCYGGWAAVGWAAVGSGLHCCVFDALGREKRSNAGIGGPA